MTDSDKGDKVSTNEMRVFIILTKRRRVFIILTNRRRVLRVTRNCNECEKSDTGCILSRRHAKLEVKLLLHPILNDEKKGKRQAGNIYFGLLNIDIVYCARKTN